MIDVTSFEENGFLIVENFLQDALIDNLKSDLIGAIEKENLYLRQRNILSDSSTRTDVGMVHNCFVYSEALMKVLDEKKLRMHTDALLCKNAIVYAYQSSSAPPSSTNYGGRIHVDAPRFIPGYRTNLGLIITLDDFTSNNGSTEVLRGSHRSSDTPDKAIFDQQCLQIKCARGAAVFFDARLWHRTGVNRTQNWRHALTINFCRPYMRARFDFPRLTKHYGMKVDEHSESARFLGFDVQTPTCLEEFYVPLHERKYKPNQE